MRTHKRTSKMTYRAMMVAVITICSWITVPSAVPFTLQTLGIFCAVGLLGAKDSFMVILVYILMGAMGLPVFSGFRGGLGHIAGPTGGFILSFLLVPLVHSFVTSFCGDIRKGNYRGMLAGQLICYLFGAAWYAVVYLRNAAASGFTAALVQCVAPFVLPDSVKIICASQLVFRLRRHIRPMKYEA